MTFFEAAVQVLREAGRPLHFKKIADQAVQRDLLSHVGKTPADTMSARLSQESAKASNEAVIVEVRPGVFGLREGVDVDDAGETISLRTPADDVPEPEPVTDDSEVEEDDEPVAPPTVVRPNDDDRRRGRRRPRRGGRRDRDESASTDASSKDDGDGAPAPRRAPRARPAGATPADRTEGLGDVAAAAADALAKGKGKPYSASKVAKDLLRAGVGALGQLGPAALRSTLTDCNARRAAEGRPPVFEEVKPNFWTLATATGSSLAASYDALDEWQADHRAALADALLDQLSALDADALGTLTTLLLDRLGYTGINAYDGDVRTVAARSPSRLVPAQIAVQIVAGNQSVGRPDVAALRGSLHQYDAAVGVLLALGDVDDDISEEIDVPNVAPITLLDGAAVTELMIGAGVGVSRFSVDVSCLDDALFRELRTD